MSETLPIGKQLRFQIGAQKPSEREGVLTKHQPPTLCPARFCAANPALWE